MSGAEIAAARRATNGENPFTEGEAEEWKACVEFAHRVKWRELREKLRDGACTATTMRGGFRIACVVKGKHTAHVTARGETW